MEKLPKISFVLCVYNEEPRIRHCLDSLLVQDYPLNKIEVLVADGGSGDKTVEIVKEYAKKYPKIIFYLHNPAKYSEGEGCGKDNTSRKANGETIAFIDADNILVQKDWIKKMIKPFENSEISAVQSRMFVPKNGGIIDRYLGAIGIEDPFAVPYSLNSQVIMCPKRFRHVKDGDYFVYTARVDNFLYAGNNGFFIRAKDFFDTGGYTRDIENFYRMAKEGYKIAVPRQALLHHKTATTLKNFILKRGKYVYRHLKHYEGREFYWFDLTRNNLSQNLKFLKTVFFNLLFVPGFFEGIEMAVKKREVSWLIHPLMLFFVTIDYCLIKLYFVLGLDS